VKLLAWLEAHCCQCSDDWGTGLDNSTALVALGPWHHVSSILASAVMWAHTWTMVADGQHLDIGGRLVQCKLNKLSRLYEIEAGRRISGGWLWR
jgi:hypothetical protein